MKISRMKRKAVAPVLATLMMIAVAVAMSVIIFVWSQGFLSQTSSAAGGQQSQQNIAAQSSLSIESAVFSDSGSSGTNYGAITIVVRNVGSVGETLGSILITGVPTNVGLQDSLICSVSGSQTASDQAYGVACSPAGGFVQGAGTVPAGTSCPAATSCILYPTADTFVIGKGQAATITVELPLTTTAGAYLASGDLVSLKLTTTAGTFASQQYTAP
jgi:archaeal type IV pilus assembly protein PilA